jgi:hypothetical protein
MSIRVNNHEVGLTSQTGATDPLKPAGPGKAVGSISGTSNEDQLDVSSTTVKINSALANQSVQHSEQVSRLEGLVAGGRYNVAATDISRSIVAGAIRGPA